MIQLERKRAVGILGGLAAFTAGLAVAGGLVLVGHAGGPAYPLSIAVAFAGVGVVGFSLHRGQVALPDAAIWAPVTLKAVAGSVGLPPAPVMAVLYVLGALGVLGNLVVPLLGRR